MQIIIMHFFRLLAQLFQTFTITFLDDYELVGTVRTTTQPQEDIPCKLELRD